MQRYRLGGRDVLLNLAKNPTGFNQNLKIVEADRASGPDGDVAPSEVQRRAREVALVTEIVAELAVLAVMVAHHAVALLAHLGVGDGVFQRAQDAFNPRNGRLQRYRLGGRDVLLNLAKNPTGVNQNLTEAEAAASWEGALGSAPSACDGDARSEKVRRIQHGEAVDFSQVDLVFMGGGPDREQKCSSQ